MPNGNVSLMPRCFIKALTKNTGFFPTMEKESDKQTQTLLTQTTVWWLPERWGSEERLKWVNGINTWWWKETKLWVVSTHRNIQRMCYRIVHLKLTQSYQPVSSQYISCKIKKMSLRKSRIVALSSGIAVWFYYCH